jgi:hypothetical protein
MAHTQEIKGQYLSKFDDPLLNPFARSSNDDDDDVPVSKAATVVSDPLRVLTQQTTSPTAVTKPKKAESLFQDELPVPPKVANKPETSPTSRVIASDFVSGGFGVEFASVGDDEPLFGNKPAQSKVRREITIRWFSSIQKKRKV